MSLLMMARIAHVFAKELVSEIEKSVTKIVQAVAIVIRESANRATEKIRQKQCELKIFARKLLIILDAFYF